MVYLVDSHCHLDRLELQAFGGSLAALIQEARKFDVQAMLCVGVDLETAEAVKAIAHEFPNVYASVGKHPTEYEGEEVSVERLLALADDPKVIAIGETGLDYYFENTQKALQKARFGMHIDAAIACDKALIIHTRNARQDTLELLRAHQASKGVLHCFTEDMAMAKAGLDLGFYISFSGILTFKNADDLRAVAKNVPLERILVETDAPYLTPAPFRGKANFPGYTHFVAKLLAELKGLSYEEVARQTTKNFEDLFGVKKIGELDGIR